MITDVTPLILTYNEEPNLGRVLDRLSWARQILVIDSFSTDNTVSVAARYPNVRLLQRTFDNHANQWNYGVDNVSTGWVLSLDADYIVPDEFTQEMAELSVPNQTTAYEARFTYCIMGIPLRASLYPSRPVLFRREHCRYYQEGHTQQLEVNGTVTRLRSRLLHDDRKPLDRWQQEQLRYAAREADHLCSANPIELGLPDRLRRRLWIAPWLVPLYCLLRKGLILDGWPGLYYVMQRTIAELLLSLHLLDRRLRDNQTMTRRVPPATPSATPTSPPHRPVVP